MNVWQEPLTPIARDPLGYMDGLDLVRWHNICDRLITAFDGELDSVLHMGLIHALEINHDIQNQHPAKGQPGYPASRWEPEPHDGFYFHSGSIDTAMTNEKLLMLINKCHAYNAAKGGQ